MTLPQRYVLGFIAGFAAVPAFHQLALSLLHAGGLVGVAPFSLRPTAPFGVPAIWSAAFWGGVWGLVFVALERYFGRGLRFAISGIVFGALALTAVAWLVVFPLKGLPLAGGWTFPGIIVGPCVNGAWGLGVVLFLRSPRSNRL